MKINLFFALILDVLGSHAQEMNHELPILEAYFNSSSIPAAVLGTVDREGKISWHQFGPSIWQDSTKIVSENDIFRLYSMTKAITSVAALQLVDKGIIDLDEPLNELMPEMVSIPILTKTGELIKSDQIITLRQLLNNTSGFGNLFFSSRLYHFETENWRHPDHPRLFEPGTAYAYGTGLDWAGKVIEKLTGQDLETYFRENITGPLQMNDTWFNVPADLSQKIVTFGNRDSSGVISSLTRIPEKPNTNYKGASGLFGSPSDYLKFLNCMLNFGKYDGGQLLKTETAKLMFEDSLPKEIKIPRGEKFDNGGIIGYSGGQFNQMKNDRWGYGWYIESDENSNRPVNSVYWGGVNTYYTLDPQNKIAIVYFSNYFPANDKESYDFYKLYEKEVYSRLAKE